jgi:hypothetical protein
VNSSGERVIGPITFACAAPAGATLAEMPITPKPTSTTTHPTCTFTTTTVSLITVEPTHGPAAGGTTVLITGAGQATSLSFGGTAVSFEHLPSGQLKAVTPPGTGRILVTAEGPSTPCPSEQFSGAGFFTYEPAVGKGRIQELGARGQHHREEARPGDRAARRLEKIAAGRRYSAQRLAQPGAVRERQEHLSASNTCL